MTITSVHGPVARRVATGRHFLMCPPTYFDVTYRINPWMHPEGRVDRLLARRQWEAVRQSYLAAGHTVDIIEPIDGLPDMVFSANGGLVIDGRAVAARFRFRERAAESAAYERWFADVGLRSLGPTSAVNEGEGDLLVAGNLVLAGTGFRTHLEAHAEISALLARPVVSLDLVDERYYHLDTALAVLSETEIAYYPDAFSARSRWLLRDLFPDALLATADDAAAFGLNAVSDGRRVFLPAGAVGLEHQLVDRGFELHPIDVSELLKAGGGVKCCTLEVRR
jgi:N-dimethylarginine dimethylaminohydrolase